jgi:hypothetical protein
VEVLETRALMDANPALALSPNQHFVAGLYFDVLGRQPHAAEVQSWASLLDAGKGRDVVLNGIFGSAEFRGHLIAQNYQLLLHRTTDASGMDHWQAQMAQGLTSQSLSGAILASDEYFQNQGGTFNAWLGGMYRDVLGRGVDPSGIAYWNLRRQQGMSLYDIAQGIVHSPELDSNDVTASYQQMLGRTPDGPGLAYWVNQMEHGLAPEQITQRVAGSDEYYTQQQGADLPVLGLNAPQTQPPATFEVPFRQLPAVNGSAFIPQSGGTGGAVNTTASGSSGTGAVHAFLSPGGGGVIYKGGGPGNAGTGGAGGSGDGGGSGNSGGGSGNSGGGSGGGGSGSGGGGLLGASLSVGPVVDVNKQTGGQSEETIAVNPNNNQQLFVASNDNNQIDGGSNGMMAAVSSDGGKTWKRREFVDGSDGLTPGFSDPWAAWDEFGNLFYSYIHAVDLANPAAGLDLEIIVSTDGGNTFSKLEEVTNIFDHPEIAAGNGLVACTYAESSNTASGVDIAVAVAAVTGKGTVGNFKVLVVPNSDGKNFGDVAIGPTGQVAVTFQSTLTSTGPGPDTAMVSVDPTGVTGQFGTPVSAAPDIIGDARVIPAQPVRNINATLTMAWDRSTGPHKGRLYLSYTGAADSTTNDTNIFVRHSDDSGATWSAPVKVNDDTTTNSQFFAHIAVDQSTGNVAEEWYDCRNDPGSGPGDTDGKPNDDVETFGSASLDGGVTWAQNVQVAKGPSNAILAGDNSGNDFGDYTGNAFAQGVFYPCWADNSKQLTGNPDPTNFDIAVAAVTVSGAPNPNPNPTPPPAGGGLADDRFEPNDTSDKATNLGTLAAGPTNEDNLTVNIHANGLPDYDWYRWTVGQNGKATVTITYSNNSGDLHLRVYTLDSQGDLLQLASSRNTHVNAQKVTVSVTQGEAFYVWVYGYNHATADYNMDLTLQ